MNQKGRILMVDDEPTNIKIFEKALKNNYTLECAKNGEEGLKNCHSFQPDLILLDIMMPGINGYEVCKKIRLNPKFRFVKIIIVSGKAMTDERLIGYEAGADDYLTKPFDPDELKAKVNVFMRLNSAEKQLRDLNDSLEEEVGERTREIMERSREIERTRNASLYALAKLAENRDTETGQHLERMRYYAYILAKNVQGFEQINDKYLETLLISAPLHDIGKVAIPDSILLKPGRLTEQEMEVMKTHSFIGYDTLATAIEQERLGSKSFMQMAAEIACYHHERWDGKGYPKGLKGREIPLSGRLCAIADVYDALTSKRVYKKEWSHEETMKIMVEGKGTQFQPELIEAFQSIQYQIQEIKRKYQDNVESSLEQ